MLISCLRFNKLSTTFTLMILVMCCSFQMNERQERKTTVGSVLMVKANVQTWQLFKCATANTSREMASEEHHHSGYVFSVNVSINTHTRTVVVKVLEANVFSTHRSLLFDVLFANCEPDSFLSCLLFAFTFSFPTNNIFLLRSYAHTHTCICAWRQIAYS